MEEYSVAQGIIQTQLKLPVFIDNDVNLVALGEWKLGAGKGYKNLVCITLGTGVGGGLVLNGELYRGEGFVAGEIGHIPLNEQGPACNCGGMGCFERYVGNRILMDKAASIFGKENIRPQDVFALANRGNALAVRFWRGNRHAYRQRAGGRYQSAESAAGYYRRRDCQ